MKKYTLYIAEYPKNHFLRITVAGDLELVLQSLQSQQSSNPIPPSYCVAVASTGLCELVGVCVNRPYY